MQRWHRPWPPANPRPPVTASPSSRWSRRSRLRSRRGNWPISARGSSRSSGRAPEISRARTTRTVQGHVEPFRLAEPVEGVVDARPQASGGGADRRPVAGTRRTSSSRTWRRERWSGSARRRRGYGERVSAADRLQHLRLRLDRAVPRQESVRPADPGRGRRALDHRHAGDAVARPASRWPTSPAGCTPSPAF